MEPVDGGGLHLATMMKGARGVGEKVWCPPDALRTPPPLPYFFSSSSFRLGAPKSERGTRRTGGRQGVGFLEPLLTDVLFCKGCKTCDLVLLRALLYNYCTVCQIMRS